MNLADLRILKAFCQLILKILLFWSPSGHMLLHNVKHINITSTNLYSCCAALSSMSLLRWNNFFLVYLVWFVWLMPFFGFGVVGCLVF